MSRTRPAAFFPFLALTLAVLLSAAAASAFAPGDQPDRQQKGAGPSPKLAPTTKPTTPPPGAVKAIPWNDPAHPSYFRYQVYLEGFTKRAEAQLPFQTKDSWAKLKSDQQATEVKEGERFLEGKFKELMGRSYISDEDKRLVEEVWGKKVVSALHNVQVARQTGNPKLLEAAIASVGRLGKELGPLSAIDWNKYFDRASGGGGLSEPPPPVAVDPLHIPKSAPFLDAIASPEVKKVLASQASFDQFIHAQPPTQVHPMAHKGLSAMYAVLSKAKEPERSEVAHLLPTVVKFIQDGHQIMPHANSPPGALAWAVADDYGRPTEVGIGPAIQNSDPLVVGNVLAHEFEHIYDDYAGRIYTLDSELRGFKTNVMYTRILRYASPENYKRLAETNDDQTRRQMADFVQVEKSYRQGTQAFVQEIAYGHSYVRGTQGYIAEARQPLRDAVGPGLLGLPHTLAGTQALRDSLKPRIAALEKERDDIQAKRAKAPSRSLDDAYLRVAKDLELARDRYSSYDRQAMIQQDQLARLQTEVKWLDSKNKKGSPAPYDLSLAVDRDYLAP